MLGRLGLLVVVVAALGCGGKDSGRRDAGGDGVDGCSRCEYCEAIQPCDPYWLSCCRVYCLCCGPLSDYVSGLTHGQIICETCDAGRPPDPRCLDASSDGLPDAASADGPADAGAD